MNPLVAGELLRYFGADFDPSVIEIKSHVAAGALESGRSNK
jgi:hypothetical protein